MEIFLQLTLLLAFFVQAAAGFGPALVAMPILIQLVGPEVASPLFILTMQTSGVGLMWRYRRSFNFGHIWRLLLAALLAIPLGSLLASGVERTLVLTTLGILLMGYALYGLFGPALPQLPQHRWAYTLGVAAGILHGAYNVGGPPLVMYSNSQDWHPFEFKSNLRFIFFVLNWGVIFSHFAQGHYTAFVLRMYLLSIPVSVVGLAIGFSLDRFIEPQRFRKAVFVILLFLGLSLIF
ncbi:MAG: sulfite exporter TauE/SafE family protein [Chloroflexi bacterium]|nr:MAG: sulfite exporter TauE/SafE family protein [Chloroflexota bacterium]